MRTRIFILSLFCFVLFLNGLSNNIKVNGEAKVVDFIGLNRDTAIVEFGLSWDNSWRDDFNWDAVWMFLKYKKRGATQEWHHAYLARDGHQATPQAGNQGSYSFMFGEVGQSASAKVTGVFLMRDGISEGSVNAKLRIKWPIKSNSKLSLTENDFGLNRDSIFIAAYAMEMVYVPYGGYALGDRFSNKTFSYIPSAYLTDEENLIGRPGCSYSASSIYSNSYLPAYALPNDGNKYWCSQTTTAEDWWQVDFGSGKTVRSFAVGTAEYAVSYAYLEGSNTAAANSWTVLWTGGANSFIQGVTYPVPQKIKVSNPGSYRYYRIRLKSVAYNSIYNVVMSEKGDNIDDSVLMITDESAFKQSGISLSASYPKGYRGYYTMKYEVSQEQYVEFLNSLTLAQQKNRVTNNNFDKMVKGDYVFGELKRPNCRNGIAFIMTKGAGTPAVFGNNLNPGNKFYSEDDGQTLACNYLSPADMLAYCDWSGLRPMSELEYEKACRRPSPQIPDKGELAWNINNGINRLRSESDLTGAYTERETPFDYKVNVNSGGKVKGPVRSGAFATSKTGQVEAGATYWGIMEMSGNLWEMSYNAETAGALFKADDPTYSHGDGYLTDAGTDIAVAYWPNVVGAVAVRGGSFTSADSLLRTSDRTWATGNYFLTFTQRDSTVGFRGARSILNSSGFSAGQILCQNGLNRDTVCPGSIYTIIGQNAVNAIGKTTYSWYISEDNGISWSIIEGATGLSLTYEKFVNETTAAKAILFKSKTICAVGEETSNVVTIYIPSVQFVVSPLKIALYKGNMAGGTFVPTPSTGNFTWLYSGKPISRTNSYTPDSVHFGYDVKIGETLYLTCEREIDKCKSSRKVEIYVDDWGCGVLIIDTRDGKVRKYGTAQYGDQCWMTNNMKLDADGKYCYGDVPAKCESTGGLYTLSAAKIICPPGWHLPSDAEWTKLKSYSVNFVNELLGWRYDYGTYCCEGTAYWWSSNQAYWYNSGTTVAGPAGGYGPLTAIGVRCVKDVK